MTRVSISTNMAFPDFRLRATLDRMQAFRQAFSDRLQAFSGRPKSYFDRPEAFSGRPNSFFDRRHTSYDQHRATMDAVMANLLNAGAPCPDPPSSRPKTFGEAKDGVDDQARSVSTYHNVPEMQTLDSRRESSLSSLAKFLKDLVWSQLAGKGTNPESQPIVYSYPFLPTVAPTSFKLDFTELLGKYWIDPSPEECRQSEQPKPALTPVEVPPSETPSSPTLGRFTPTDDPHVEDWLEDCIKHFPVPPSTRPSTAAASFSTTTGDVLKVCRQNVAPQPGVKRNPSWTAFPRQPTSRPDAPTPTPPPLLAAPTWQERNLATKFRRVRRSRAFQGLLAFGGGARHEGCQCLPVLGGEGSRSPDV